MTPENAHRAVVQTRDSAPENRRETVARAQALWLKVRAGTATVAELADHQALKAQILKAMS